MTADMTEIRQESLYTLDPQLAADCTLLGRTNLCDVLMFNTVLLPWVILVPRRAPVTEIYQLSESDQGTLWQESSLVGKRLMQTFSGHSLNVAALGNVVSQLHVHHIVRYQNDACWPKPVWDNLPKAACDASDLQRQAETITTALGDLLL